MNKKKHIVFLIDGMADEPLPELDGLTPLMKAHTPNLDKLAQHSIMGELLTLPEPYPTSSDVANLSVLGFDLSVYTGRGPIEASGLGIKLADDEIALRCNIIHEKNGILHDYSAGHIDNQKAGEMIKILKKNLENPEIKFHAGTSYRHLLILKGSRFSDKIGYAKPDSSHGKICREIYPCALKKEAETAANLLIELINASKKILAPFNTDDLEYSIWPWSPGKKPLFPSFKNMYNKKAAVITAVDVIKGIARLSGMTICEVSGANGFTDTNFTGKAEAALKMLESHDFVFCHLECVDEVSHMGNLPEKIRAIELFDEKLLGHFLHEAGYPEKSDNLVIACLPDHPVPVHLRAHTRTPVPFLISGPFFPVNSSKYNEISVKTGSCGLLKKNEFMKKLFSC
ncbi:MAG: cofactor-independent phosphoglycerate mutase [Spirochaetes bacterium GWF1_41_5]|nr:MAG: cofactor-independent phosphoglycerate mutase [Spirochaetes bacterium GWF1_41_5]HBE03907.1 phosphoglycerate mutase [Spirochaetia bacterium]